MSMDAVTDFLRYHVLVRVFNGDVHAWLRIAGPTDRPFLQWLARRLANDPGLLTEVRAMVDACGLWPNDT